MGLSWRLSNTQDSAFGVDALEEAITRYGCPEIFNTDQVSQFTAETFTESLRSRNVAISMDGKSRWRDNVFIERLWKSVKYEDIYQKAYGSMAEVKNGLGDYFTFYNERRWHHNFDRKTPAMVYCSTLPQKQGCGINLNPEQYPTYKSLFLSKQPRPPLIVAPGIVTGSICTDTFKRSGASGLFIRLFHKKVFWYLYQ